MHNLEIVSSISFKKVRAIVDFNAAQFLKIVITSLMELMHS